MHEVSAGPTDIWKVAFSPDGMQVVSGSHSGKLIVYGIEKGTTDRVLDTRGKFALSVAWVSQINKIFAFCICHKRYHCNEFTPETIIERSFF